MPHLFEVFGYPLTDDSQEAEASRQGRCCPFMGSPCDGGGNRYLSNLNLAEHPELSEYFGTTESIPSGVCSISVSEDTPPWIVCPRRLMVLGRYADGEVAHQDHARELLILYAGFETDRIGVWPELKLKYREGSGYSAKSFDYTFDYLLMPIRRTPLAEAARAVGVAPGALRTTLEHAGYTMAIRDGQQFVEDFPSGSPCIVEIMTSSTSGGNKAKRTTIPMAFSDAIMRRPHQGPGINYRQVWARMVSQLVVKSEVGMGWGGKTFWVLQETLVDYISRSTALNIREFLSEVPSEVNVLSLEYGDECRTRRGPIELSEVNLYAGPISPPGSREDVPAFQDMIRAPIKPSLSFLLQALVKKSPTNVIQVD